MPIAGGRHLILYCFGRSVHTQSSLLETLFDLKLKPETLEHEAVFRVGEGDEIKAKLKGAHTKNLFVRDQKGRQFLISAEQSTQISLKALEPLLSCGRLSFGSEDRLMRALKVRPGSVTALALINDPDHGVKFILDKVLYEAEFVNFHPLVNTATTTLSQSDFRIFLKALKRNSLVVDFCEMRSHIDLI
jgi:Ala-tRNA(Pro) deacylase